MHREIVIDRAALNRTYLLQLPGCACLVHTNSHTLGRTLCRWRSTDVEHEMTALQMNVLVRAAAASANTEPHFRGMQHLVVASFGPSSVFLFDLLRRTVSAVVSKTLAEDQHFWDRLLLPIVMGVLGPAVGVVPIHAACLALGNSGILIAGASGAGKSTLSVALAQEQMHFVSDDWSYLALRGGRLLAHGMSLPAKLLPDAINYFPLLEHYSTGISLNQELAYELPAEDLGTQVRAICEPRWFFFLERQSTPGCRIVPVSSGEALCYVERSVERLPAQLERLTRARSAVIEHVHRLSCWKLTYGGPPRTAVRALREFLADRREGALQ